MTKPWRELNGLRGVAVSLVMLHHFTAGFVASGPVDYFALQALATGWAGVEIFFVISGFLITKSLLESRGGPHYFRNFYGRRALRILPLYYSVLAVYYAVLFFIPSILSEGGAAPLRSHWYLFWLNCTNVFSYLHLGTGSLGPLWTLAMEEQFYLVWPLALWVTPDRFLRRLMAGVLVGSFVVRSLLIAAGMQGQLAYVTTPIRLEGFALGALLYTLLDAKKVTAYHRFVSAPVVAVSAGALVYIFLSKGDGSTVGVPSYGLLAFALLSGGVVWNLVTRREGAIGAAFFNSRPLQRLGDSSYACYLLNFPLWFAMNKSGLVYRLKDLFSFSELAFRLSYVSLLFAATLFLAHLTGRFIEKPALRLKRFLAVAPPHSASAEKRAA